jgi:hypothetical protein
MITSFRRLFLALLIGSGFVFSGTVVLPGVAAAQEQKVEQKAEKKKKKSTKKKSTKKKSTKKKTPKKVEEKKG